MNVTRSAHAARPASPRPRKLAGWRLAVVRASLAAFGLFLAVATLEIGLRLVGVRVPTATAMSTFFEFDPLLGWHGRPHAVGRFTTYDFDTLVTLDAEGWRTTSLAGSPGRAPPSSLDDDTDAPEHVVWFVGDSMTWGWGVNDGESFVDELNRQSGPGVRYRNLGVPGYSSVQEYLLLRRQFEMGRRPDQVVVFFCPNDWEGNLSSPNRDRPHPWAARHEGGWRIEGTPVPLTLGWQVRGWLLRNSQAFGFLNYHVKRLRQQTRAVDVDDDFAAASSREPTPDERDALRFAYGEMARLCREQGVEFCVATDFHRYRAVEEICASLGVRFLNTGSETPEGYDPRTAPRERRLFFAADPHWTRLGHTLVARGLRDELEPAAASTAARENSPATKR